MPVRRILLWTVLALAGLLVAVAVTMAATSLTSQRVGLQSEPLDAGEALAPGARRERATPTPDPTATPSPETGEDEDDDSGRGRGRNRGRGGDDD